MRGSATRISVCVAIFGVAFGLLGVDPADPAPGPLKASAAQVHLKKACGTMGANRNYSDERPAHKVCLSGYHLDKTEVTVAAYARCVAAGRCTAAQAYASAHPTRSRCNYNRPGYGPHPINCVTWKQADQYCRKSGGRLPTEAEWERAARQDKGELARRRAFDCRHAALSQPAGGKRHHCPTGQTRPVGTSPSDRSRAGVEDLTGNVSEWVNDWFALGIYRKSRTQDPRGARRGRARSVRGCSYQCVAGSRLLWPSARQFAVTWDPSIGFRCARSAK